MRLVFPVSAAWVFGDHGCVVFISLSCARLGAFGRTLVSVQAQVAGQPARALGQLRTKGL